MIGREQFCEMLRALPHSIAVIDKSGHEFYVIDAKDGPANHYIGFSVSETFPLSEEEASAYVREVAASQHKFWCPA